MDTQMGAHLAVFQTHKILNLHFRNILKSDRIRLKDKILEHMKILLGLFEEEMKIQRDELINEAEKDKLVNIIKVEPISKITADQNCENDEKSLQTPIEDKTEEQLERLEKQGITSYLNSLIERYNTLKISDNPKNRETMDEIEKVFMLAKTMIKLPWEK